jgi:hypothetical protein
VRKKPRNLCGICGQLFAGHTCKRIQDFNKLHKKLTKAEISNLRKSARKHVLKRAADFSYSTETDDIDDVDMDLDIILPTEEEILEAFMYM